MTNQKRIKELSLMNILLCLLVIFIHACSSAVNGLDSDSWQYALVIPVWRWASFAMQGFVFLAGIKFAFSAEKPDFSYPRYYLNRLLRVAVPYLIANLIYLAYFLWRDFYVFTPAGFLKNLLNGDLAAHLYFIVIILQFYLLAPLWRPLVRKHSPMLWTLLLLLSFMLSRLPVQGNWLLPYLHYWVGGMAIGAFYPLLRNAFKRYAWAFGLFFGAAAIAQGHLSWLHFSGRQSIDYLETVHDIYVAAAILFAFSLSIRFSDKPLPKPLPLLDRSTFSIYLWHVLVLYETDRYLYLLGITDIALHFICRFLFTLGVTLGLCCGFAWLTHRLKQRRLAAKES